MCLYVCSSESLHNSENSETTPGTATVAVDCKQKTMCVYVKTAVCDVLKTIQIEKNNYLVKFFYLN